MDTLVYGRALMMRGFALLTMLVVVALISILLGGLVYQQGREIVRTQVLLNQAQAMVVASGLEAWVRKGLVLDAQHTKIDSLKEQWAQPLPPIPFAGGEVSGDLQDAQALINLNNLGLSPQAQQSYWRGVIQRLFQAKKIPQAQVDVVQDWVDQDEEPLPQGAESDDYLLRQPAYRSANRPLVILQSLHWLKGFDQAAIEHLQDVAVALPKLTPVNVNTAPAQVLQALSPWLDEALAKQWVQARDETPAQKVEVFQQFMAKASGKKLDEVKKSLPAWALTVKSNYFILHGTLHYGAAKVKMGGLFYRKENASRLLMRWFEPVWN